MNSSLQQKGQHCKVSLYHQKQEVHIGSCDNVPGLGLLWFCIFCKTSAIVGGKSSGEHLSLPVILYY